MKNKEEGLNRISLAVSCLASGIGLLALLPSDAPLRGLLAAALMGYAFCFVIITLVVGTRQTHGFWRGLEIGIPLVLVLVSLGGVIIAAVRPDSTGVLESTWLLPAVVVFLGLTIAALLRIIRQT